jgi:hypothetical protein
MTFLPAVRLLLDRRAQRLGRLPQAEALGVAERVATLPRVIGRTAWLAERAPVPTLVVAVLLVGARRLRVHPARQRVQPDRLRAAGRAAARHLRDAHPLQRRVRGVDRGPAHGRLATPTRTTRSSPRSRAGEVDDVETLGDVPTPPRSCPCSARRSATTPRAASCRGRGAGGPDGRRRHRRRGALRAAARRGPRRRRRPRPRRRRLARSGHLRTSAGQAARGALARTCRRPSRRSRPTRASRSTRPPRRSSRPASARTSRTRRSCRC